MRSRYRRRPGTTVRAIQVPDHVEAFDYFRWGQNQRCEPGDWIVIDCRGLESDVGIHLVAKEEFARTHRSLGRGRYEKTTRVWAEKATEAGAAKNSRGATSYEPGQVRVWNDESGTDAYAMDEAEFERLYELDD